MMKHLRLNSASTPIVGLIDPVAPPLRKRCGENSFV
jgi:hypothetical protein